MPEARALVRPWARAILLALDEAPASWGEALSNQLWLALVEMVVLALGPGE